MNLKFYTFLSLFFLINLSVFCQTTENDSIKNDSTDIDKKSYFTVGLNYETNSVSAGRAVSASVNPNIGLSLCYNFKWGGYLNADTGILPTQTTTSTTIQPNIFGGLSLQGGYGFPVFEDVLTADLNYTHYLFQNSSKVLSEVQGTASGKLSFDFNWLQADLVTNYSYGNSNSDILFNFSISKSLNLFPIGKDTLTITPTLSSFAGTQNLIGLHLRKVPKRITNVKLKNAILAENTRLITESKIFNYLDTDISLPVSYMTGIFTFEITPTLSIPLNIIEPKASSYFAKNPFFLNFSVSVQV